MSLECHVRALVAWAGLDPSYSSSQLSPPLRPADINKNRQVTTEQQERRRHNLGDSEALKGPQPEVLWLSEDTRTRVCYFFLDTFCSVQ